MKLYSIYNLRCSFLKYSIQSRLFISLLWQGSWITSNEVITGKINFINILPFIKHILYSYNTTDSTLLLQLNSRSLYETGPISSTEHTNIISYVLILPLDPLYICVIANRIYQQMCPFIDFATLEHCIKTQALMLFSHVIRNTTITFFAVITVQFVDNTSYNIIWPILDTDALYLW